MFYLLLGVFCFVIFFIIFQLDDKKRFKDDPSGILLNSCYAVIFSLMFVILSTVGVMLYFESSDYENTYKYKTVKSETYEIIDNNGSYFTSDSDSIFVYTRTNGQGFEEIRFNKSDVSFKTGTEASVTVQRLEAIKDDSISFWVGDIHKLYNKKSVVITVPE